jgi:hypothetical protein
MTTTTMVTCHTCGWSDNKEVKATYTVTQRDWWTGEPAKFDFCSKHTKWAMAEKRLYISRVKI